MESRVRAYLASLGSLQADRAGSQFRACKMCSGRSGLFATQDFLKYCSEDHPDKFGRSGLSVEYFRCEGCECIFTEFFDGWTDDDFAQFIYNDDYIKVDEEYTETRPRRTADYAANLFAGAERQRFLDYGSGSGVFAEEMRRRGFAGFTCYDPFSHPVRPSGTYDVVTCFEVIEHTTRPREVISEMLGFVAPGGCLIVGQTLQPPDIDELRGDWWYLGPRNGHATTFSPHTLEVFARANGLLFHEGEGLFGLSSGPLSEHSRRILGAVATAIHHRVFHAPSDAIETYADWHTPEYDAGRAFRWTSSNEIVLAFHRFERGIHRVRVPFFQEMYQGFRRACRIRIGAVERRMVPRGEMLEAEFRFTEPYGGPVVLRTPPTLSPFQRDGTSDFRQLGMAVFCAEAGPRPGRSPENPPGCAA